MGVISCFNLLWSATALCEMKWMKKRPTEDRKKTQFYGGGVAILFLVSNKYL